MRPPAIAASAARGSASHSSIRAAVTTSKRRGSCASDATSASSKERFAWRSDRSRARPISSLLTSMPSAWPVGATACAMPSVIAPVPQPTSSTVIPGRSSSARRLCASVSERASRKRSVPEGMCARWIATVSAIGVKQIARHPSIRRPQVIFAHPVPR